MTREEIKNSSRTKVIEYFVNEYMFDGKSNEELSSNMIKVLAVLDEWFGKNDKKWQVDKVYEEFEESRDALKAWKQSKDEFTRFHVIVEVSDFLAAFASFVKKYIGSVDEKDIKDEDSEFIEMLGTIKGIIELVEITPKEVVINIENKFLEIYMGLTTYRKLKSGDTRDILCRVIRTLYTTKEINDANNEKKIVKEIRRMWYAREFNKIFD
mgnify:FL=1